MSLPPRNTVVIASDGMITIDKSHANYFPDFKPIAHVSEGLVSHPVDTRGESVSRTHGQSVSGAVESCAGVV